MGDNSFGPMPPWVSQGQGTYNYQQATAALQAGGTRAQLDPRLLQQRRPQMSMMNGFPSQNMQNMPPAFSTPMSVAGMGAMQMATASMGGTYPPMWDMEVPNQMFMQAMNFDRLLAQQQQQAGISQLNTSRPPEDPQNDSSSDLIEQQQAVEQARLLQRFKELRSWQQQQQEMLMSQQQQQLSVLKKERERMQQHLITKQRDNQWGGGNANMYSDMSTPPRRQQPASVNGHMTASAHQPPQNLTAAQAVHSLPKPVIYTQPEDDDDEIKTNPDLFSDTNSNRGSQATVEDGMFPIPDSASEASVDVGFLQQRVAAAKQPVQFRQRFNKHEMDAPKKHHRSFAELEADTEFLNLSSQSPTFLDVHNSVQTRPSESNIIEESEHGKSDDEDEDDSDDDSDDDDDDSEEESDQEDTQIEVKPSLDDIPIKPGIEGGKTFEQLLEEQLRAEEERLKRATEGSDSPAQTKRSFLKKGQGIARFDQQPAKRPPRSKKSSASTGAKSTTETASSGAQSKQAKPTSKAASQPKSGTQKPPAGSSKQQKPETSKALKTDKDKKTGSQPVAKQPDKSSKGVHKTDAGGNERPRKAESIPDDASFVASLKDRQKESEVDLEELDEFEILEQFADNMSFCSNSSIVTKGLKGLQSDRILPGPGPTGQSQNFVRPASPRAALIKKLEQIKETKTVHDDKLAIPRHANKPQHIVTNKQPPASKTDTDKDSAAKFMMGQKDNLRQHHKHHQSSDDSDDDDDDSDDDDDDKSKGDRFKDSIANKYSSHKGSKSQEQKSGLHACDGWMADNKLFRLGGSNSELNREPVATQNDSVCSTDKKLARALSYTAMTEASSLSSDSEEESSDSDEQDSNSDEEIVVSESPSKILTRKIAPKHLSQNSGEKDLLLTGLTVNPFGSKAKSPLVISKEKIGPLDLIKEETKFSYHSDTDSLGKGKNGSFSDEEERTCVSKSSKSSFGEKKILQFDDDDEWEDLTPKMSRRRLSSGDGDHNKTLVEANDKPHTSSAPAEGSKPNVPDSPPTSKLMTKLFPQLKPVQQIQDEQVIQKVKAASQVEVGEGVQSKVLRDKLVELEREIEKFRTENAHLAKLRTEREEGLLKLKKEIAEFEKEKVGELRRIEEFRTEEMKKLKHERKMFDKYQKAARAGPDKKEREEIEMLKMQLSELQEEMKRKESRWTASSGRLRDKLEHVEQENEELREEVKLLERKRLEWMQKGEKSKGVGVSLRSSTPTDDHLNHVDHHLSNGVGSEHHIDNMNDLSTVSSVRPAGKSQQQLHSKSNIRSGPQSHSNHSSHNAHSHSTQSTHTGKPVNHMNTNQSAKHTAGNQNVNQSAKHPVGNQKGNQANKKSTHNTKQQSHSGHGHSQNAPKPGHKVGQTKGGHPGKADVKNLVLRSSLQEDVPRQQDVSMYSEGEVSIQAPSNLPRKLASSKYGVDHSVIDKGDHNDFDEIQHSDGKVERTYKSGAREILFSNGTKKEISSDGKSIIVSFFNGDIKQIMPDQRVIYYYAENQTTHTNYPDGLEILQFPNGQTEKLYPDGTKEITFGDQTIKYIFPNGSEESIFPDGTVIRLEKNGDKTMEFPNGQREIHTNEYKRREYPDGTVKTVYPDGRQETRYSNGRLRVKDQDGNIIIDRQC